jgi:antitoxin component YwqK of YwqJK toxin-antitoxin module
MNVINFLKFVGDKRPEYEFEKQLVKMKVNGTSYPYSGKGTIGDDGKKDGQFESYAYHQEPGVARWMDKKKALETGEGVYLKSVFNYKDGRTEGKQTTYYENGQIESEYFYVNGNKSGDEKQYYENGQLKSKVTYENGIKNGLEITYNEDGKVTHRGTWYRGNKHGKFTTYSRDGKKVLDITNYDMGLHDGQFVKYWPNGNVNNIGQFKNGVEYGKFENFTQNGNLKMEYVYDNRGKLLYKSEYYPSGGMDYEYHVGETHTDFVRYHEGTNNIIKQKYSKNSQGFLDGEFIEYDRNGNVTQKYMYRDNRVVN